tara:strand:- start:851 stop:1765 length:915 start_codon:yes stop_codon:yes gene_type:complete
MKCLVTGGAGFIGSNLVDKLIKEGHDVVIVDDMSTGKKSNINEKAKFFNHDIRKKFTDEIMNNVDVVFHLAALARVQPSIEDPITYHDVNVNGTLNLLKACVDYNVNRFVFSSSSSVYGDVEEKDLPTSESAELSPMSPYAIHKLIGEQYCKLFSKLYGIETVCLRYFNVYGERQPIEGAYTLVMGVFAQQMLKGAPMTIRGDGEQRRDFTYVGDVVNANIKAGFNSKIPIFKCQGDIFNIGNGDNLSVSEIADLMGGSRVHVKPVIEPKVTLADYSHTENILDWKPTGDLRKWIPKWKEELGL